MRHPPGLHGQGLRCFEQFFKQLAGAPDPIRDEVPVAFVVALDPASPPTPDELAAWCAERLGKPKVPREFTLIDELPRTSVGKIRKFLLNEETHS